MMPVRRPDVREYSRMLPSEQPMASCFLPLKLPHTASLPDSSRSSTRVAEFVSSMRSDLFEFWVRHSSVSDETPIAKPQPVTHPACCIQHNARAQ